MRESYAQQLCRSSLPFHRLRRHALAGGGGATGGRSRDLVRAGADRSRHHRRRRRSRRRGQARGDRFPSRHRNQRANIRSPARCICWAMASIRTSPTLAISDRQHSWPGGTIAIRRSSPSCEASDVAITMAEVEAEAGGKVIGRPHIAAILMRKGYVTSIKQAFDKYLAPGGLGLLSTRSACRRRRRLK